MVSLAKYSMNFRFCAFVLAAASLVSSLQSPMAIASTEEESNRLMFYGVGIGFGALMCDFLENKILDQTMAGIVISNMRSEMKTGSSYTEYKLGPIRRQAVKDGFNASVKEMSECDLKF